jgi:predicted amidohydrolase YtcJ
MGVVFCKTILYNGKVITLDAEFSIAEAVAIGGKKFLKVGTNREVRDLANQETEVIDLKGRIIVPGFVDTHPHVIVSGIRRQMFLPLKGLQSIEEIKKRIAEHVKTTPLGEWVVTAPVGDPPDYFHLPGTLREKRWPTRWDLDDVSPNNPVYISSPTTWAPHPAVLNSYALNLLGITKNTPLEEQGTIIVKDSETREPNGQLHGMHLWNYGPLYRKLMSMLPSPTFEEKTKGLEYAIKDFITAGVTAGYEGHIVTSEHLRLCKELWSKNALKMRIYFAYEIDVDKPLQEIRNWMKELTYATGSGFGDDHLMIGGVTVSMDGPSQLGVSVMRKPYLDPFGNTTRGVQQVSSKKLEEIAFFAANNNLRMNIQVGGDKATDIALEAYEAVNKQIPIKGRRWVLQHIQHPSQENIAKCKEMGIAVTTVSNFEYSKGEEVYRNRLRGDYCERAVPLRDWIDADVLVAQSTDGAHYHPMFTLWQSLKRVDGRTGKTLMTPNKKITREEALRLYTINGAQVLFWEDKIGSIEPGKLADIVVLNKDILTCELDEIRNTRTLLTMVGGEIVYQAEEGL